MTLLGSHVFLLLAPQLQEAQTLRYIFLENSALCYEVTERVVQHLVHSIESRGRHVELLKALQTLVKAEGQSIRKTQDMVMAEVRKFVCLFVCLFVLRFAKFKRKREQLLGSVCSHQPGKSKICFG